MAEAIPPRMFPLQASRTAPAGPRQIPWQVAEIAYGEYSRLYGSSQSLDRLAERGGFGWCEMDAFYPGWRTDVDERTALKAALEEECRLREQAEARVRELERQLAEQSESDRQLIIELTEDRTGNR